MGAVCMRFYRQQKFQLYIGSTGFAAPIDLSSTFVNIFGLSRPVQTEEHSPTLSSTVSGKHIGGLKSKILLTKL